MSIIQQITSRTFFRARLKNRAIRRWEILPGHFGTLQKKSPIFQHIDYYRLRLQ